MSAYIRYTPIAVGGGGGGGGSLTIGTFDSQTPSADALVIAAQKLYAQSASDTVPGMMNTSTQTFAGAKTFSGGILTNTITKVGGSSTMVDVQNAKLQTTSGQQTVDWQNRYTSDSGNATSVDWQNRRLYDSSNAIALDWTTTGVDVLKFLTVNGASTTYPLGVQAASGGTKVLDMIGDGSATFPHWTWDISNDGNSWLTLDNPHTSTVAMAIHAHGEVGFGVRPNNTNSKVTIAGQIGEDILRLTNAPSSPGNQIGGYAADTSTLLWRVDSTGNITTPSLNLSGLSSGTISILPQAAAGTYNFNLPTTAGTSGYALTSGGGGSSPMTWTAVQSPLTIGDLTDAGTDGITITGGTGAVIGSGTSISQHVADGSHNGYLSSSDWTTFNNKQAAGSYITALTSDVTASGPGSAAATIAAHAVTLGKMAQLGAHTYIGNNTGSTADPIAVTSTQLTADLNLFTSSLQGMTPSSGGGTTNFLRADGTWAAPAGGMSNPMTTTGDIIYGTNTASPSTPGRLGIGSANQVLGALGSQTSPSYRTIYEAAAGPNYIAANPNAEVDTTGWTTYNDGASNIPVDGTGGTATNLTFSRSTSSPLRGSGQFSMVQANSTNIQGKGVSYDFTLDAADQAQPITISFNYNASSTFVAGDGFTAPLNDNTTSTNAGNSDIEVFVYDKTNSQLIYVINETITSKGSNNFVYQSTFQAASNSTSYRLIFHVATASANATGWTFLFDNVYVGPQAAVQGAAMTDWVAYTPTFTGFGTVSAVNFTSRRVGGSLEVYGEWTNGTVTGSVAQITLGYAGANNNVTISSTAGLNSGTNYVGNGAYATNTAVQLTVLGTPGNGYLNLGLQATGNSGLTATTGSTVAFSSGTMSIHAMVPISGWASNVNMASSTRNSPTVQTFTSGSGTYTTPSGVKYIRVRMVGGGGGGGGSGGSGSAGAGGDGGNTTFGSSLHTAGGGTHGAQNGDGGAGGTATLGAGGVGIAVSGGAGGGSSAAIGTSAFVQGGGGGTSAFGGSSPTGYQGGSGKAGATNTGSGGAGGGCGGNSGTNPSGAGGGAGAYLDFIIASPAATYAYAVGAAGSAGTAGTNGQTGGAGGSGYIVVEEYYANAGAVGADTNVNCRYTNTAGTSLTKSAANTVPFATKDYDTNNAFATNTFTAPVYGKYKVQANVTIATGATWASGDFIELDVYKNGALHTGGNPVLFFGTYVGAITAQVSATVSCVPGDTITINCNPTKAASGNVSLNTTAGYNAIAIERVGS